MRAEPFREIPRLSPDARTLLELAPDHPLPVHDRSWCGVCAGGAETLSFDLLTLRETVMTALAHGHSVTLHPRPTEWHIGLTIHPRAGECDCAPEGSGG